MGQLSSSPTPPIDEAALVADFYDAAFDATLWPDRLLRLAEFSHGIGAELLLWDTQADVPVLLVTSGHGGIHADAYKRDYWRLDPYRPIVASKPLGQWSAAADFFDDGFVATDRFFTEYLAPRGIRHVAAARLVASGRVDVFVSIHRGYSAFSKDEIERFERIGRQLGRALATYVDVTRAQAAQDAGMASAEQTAPPFALVDGARAVLFASAAADALLEAEAVLRLDHRRLIAHRATDEARLQRLVASATGAYQPTGGEMLIERGDGQMPLVLSVTPVAPTRTLHSLALVPAALILVRDPSRRAAILPERLQTLFNLSAAEAALTQGLLEGRRLTEIATIRQVSGETVRTQLRSVFRKTGVTRQSELLRLLNAIFFVR